MVVERQERLFQVGLGRQQVDDLMPGGCLDQRVEAAVDGAAQHRAGHARRRSRRAGGELGGVDRLVEVDLDGADRAPPQRLDPFDGGQPAVADDRDPVGGLLHLGQDVRGHEHGLPGARGPRGPWPGTPAASAGPGRWSARRGSAAPGGA